MKRLSRHCYMALPLAAALCALHLSAATLPITLDTEISGSGGVLSGSGEITATFNDGGATGSVDLTLDLTGLTDSQDFLSAFYFNFTGDDFTGFDITSSDPAFDGFVTGFDSFQADGDGFFDVRVDFNTANDADRLTGGESATLTVTYDGLTVDFFDAESAPGGGNGTWTAIAKVQGLGAGDNSSGSGWFGGNPGNGGGGEIPDVPEPSTLLLMGGSLLGLACFRRRRAGSN